LMSDKFLEGYRAALGRHSLMDIFTAAGQAASPFIRERTERLKEQNDLELKNDAARFATDVDNYIRENPYKGNFGEYEGKLKAYVNERYDEYGAGNSSPYFQKNIARMRTQALEAARGYALTEEDKWLAGKENVSRGEDMRRYAESLPPELAFYAIENRMRISQGRVRIDPEDAHKELEGWRRGVYLKHLGAALEGVERVADLEAVLKAADERLTAMLPPETLDIYDEDGAVTGSEKRAWGFAGKEEAKEELADLAIERIQRANLERALTADELYDKAMNAYTQTGNASYKRRAEEIAAGYAGVQGAIANDGELTEYADKDRNTLARLFRLHPDPWAERPGRAAPARGSGGGGGGGGGRAPAAPKPAKEPKPPAYTSATRNAYVEAYKNYVEYSNAVENGDATPNSSHISMPEGKNLQDIYYEIDEYFGSDKDAAAAERRKLDALILTEIEKKSGNTAGQIRGLLTLMDGVDDEKEMERAVKHTSKTATEIKAAYFERALDILAQADRQTAERMKRGEKEEVARKEVWEDTKDRLKTLDNTYTGKAVKLLMDKKGKTTYQKGFEDGGERDLAKRLGLLEAGTEGLVSGDSRHGGPAEYGGLNEQTGEAMYSRQQELLEQIPGLKGTISREGGFSVATYGKDKYQLGKGPNGALQLKRLENGKWVAVAERVTAQDTGLGIGTFWAETDKNGKVKKRSFAEAERYKDSIVKSIPDNGTKGGKRDAIYGQPVALFEYYPFTGLGLRDGLQEYAGLKNPSVKMTGGGMPVDGR
jgi:hypothetical protein